LRVVRFTEFEAWRPAFGDEGPSLVSLARKYAPSLTIIANGSLHDPDRANQLLQEGADVIALGRGALSNPSWPRRVQAGQALQDFDRRLLATLGNIKQSELALAE
jgi:2,4-dienoyl-CoA reductase-like NADH-dependent reductase (Old Yellow Enzyme family)